AEGLAVEPALARARARAGGRTAGSEINRTHRDARLIVGPEDALSASGALALRRGAAGLAHGNGRLTRSASEHFRASAIGIEQEGFGARVALALQRIGAGRVAGERAGSQTRFELARKATPIRGDRVR